MIAREQNEIRGGPSVVQTTKHCILQRSLQILDADNHNGHYFFVDVETDLNVQHLKLFCENHKSLSVKVWNFFGSSSRTQTSNSRNAPENSAVKFSGHRGWHARLISRHCKLCLYKERKEHKNDI